MAESIQSPVGENSTEGEGRGEISFYYGISIFLGVLIGAFLVPEEEGSFAFRAFAGLATGAFVGAILHGVAVNRGQ